MTMFDPPPTIEEFEILTAPFDCWQLNPRSERANRCGSGREHTWRGGDFESNVTMCQSLRCWPRSCSRYKIERRPLAADSGGWLAQYEGMGNRLFDAPVIYWQPFPVRRDETLRKLRSPVRRRVERRNARALVASTLDAAMTHAEVAHHFSDADLSTSRPKAHPDRWPSRRLSPEDARWLLLDVILRPGTLAEKPTTLRAPEWSLAFETDEDDEDMVKMPTIDLGWTDPEIAEDVKDAARAFMDQWKPKDVARRDFGNANPDVVKRAFDHARAKVMGERQPWVADTR